jgi:predicted nucleotidyltransferase
MPTRTSDLSNALFTKVQQRVLGIIFGNPDRTFYANEIIRLAGSGTGAVQRELAKLQAAGLVVVERVGNQKHFRANKGAPVFEELSSLVFKTSGLADVVRAVLAPLARQIHVAFIFGSFAKNGVTTSSDVDLMLISDTLAYPDIFAALESAAQRLGRAVNPTIYTPSEFAKRVEHGNAFVSRVLAQPKIWLIGSDDALAA